MADKTLQQDLNRLAKPAPVPGKPLEDRVQASPLLETIGLASYAGKSANSATRVRSELLNVYSSLIITADGAFEKPPGWPESGVYPGASPMSPVPDSFSDATTLDVDVEHYEQKRVHLTAFSDGQETTIDSYTVKLEAPYSASGYYQGAAAYVSAGALTLKLSITPGPFNIDALVSSLLNAGVVLE